MSIHRCPHDKENPYAQISRSLIRDKSISFECRAFIIYCLSYDSKWEISIPYFMKEQDVSKNRMYRILDEAIAAGYIKRETYVQDGLKKYKYYVSEFPKFKEFLPCPQKRDTENEDTTNKQLYNERASNPLPPSKGEAAEASEKDLLRKELQKKLSPEQFEHGFKVYQLKAKLEKIESPAGLIFRAGKERWPIPASVSSEEENFALMDKIGARCKDFIHKNQLMIGYNYIEFPWSTDCPRIETHEKRFRESVLSQLRKMNIDVSGL